MIHFKNMTLATLGAALLLSPAYSFLRHFGIQRCNMTGHN
jgi:hypothetical protein